MARWNQCSCYGFYSLTTNHVLIMSFYPLNIDLTSSYLHGDIVLEIRGMLHRDCTMSFSVIPQEENSVAGKLAIDRWGVNQNSALTIWDEAPKFALDILCFG